MGAAIAAGSLGEGRKVRKEGGCRVGAGGLWALSR